jgi:hypothetical protein
VPLPLPIDIDSKNNDSKDRVNLIQEIRKKNGFFSNNNNNSELASGDMDDLIHLLGPLTEDAVMKTLQARFNEKKYFVSFQ